MAFKLFIQHMFSLTSLGWTEGLFLNQRKNKQGVKDFHLTDLAKFALTQICERTLNKYDTKGHFLKEERTSFCLEPMEWKPSCLDLHNYHLTFKRCCFAPAIDSQKVSPLCSKQLWPGSSEAQVDICGHLASGRGKGKPDAVG